MKYFWLKFATKLNNNKKSLNKQTFLYPSWLLQIFRTKTHSNVDTNTKKDEKSNRFISHHLLNFTDSNRANNKYRWKIILKSSFFLERTNGVTMNIYTRKYFYPILVYLVSGGKIYFFSGCVNLRMNTIQ